MTPLDALLSAFPPYGLYLATLKPTADTTPQASALTNPYSAAQTPMAETVGVSLNVAPGITTGLSDWVNKNTNTVMILIAIVGCIIMVVPAFTGRTGRH